MRAEKHRGFVLGHTSLSTSRAIVNLYTRESGKRQGVVRLTKKEGRAWLSPLTSISFQFSGKEHQELQRISEITLESHHYDLAADYLGLTFCQHWAFLLQYSQPDGFPDEKVYRLMDHCVGALSGPLEPHLIAIRNLYFEIWLLHFCGVLPKPHGGALFAQGADSGEARLLSSLDLGLLKHIFKSKIDQLDPSIPKPIIKKASELLGQLWEQFLSKDLKTRKILYTLLAQKQIV